METSSESKGGIRLWKVMKSSGSLGLTQRKYEIIVGDLSAEVT